jgi:hypothetical protein
MRQSSTSGSDDSENPPDSSPHDIRPLSSARHRHGRQHQAARHLAAHCPRPARFTTVWPCAQNVHLTGTGMLADWLLNAVIKIVTTYSTPGDRVLLLAPPPSGAQSSRPRYVPRRSGPYCGLLEAAWPVVRLGRRIQTRTAGAEPDLLGRDVISPTSESGPGPHRTSPDSDSRHATADRDSGWSATETDPVADRVDLIITAAENDGLDWLRPADWAGVLARTGFLCVITRGDHSRSRLADAAGPLVRAAHHAGLRYLDRIALLRTPIRNSALAVPSPATEGRTESQRGSAMTPVLHTQVLDDLLVFAHRSVVDGRETSDD